MRRHAPKESAAALTRTSMCSAAAPRRAVHLHAAGARTDHYLELIAAVEATAEALDQPIVIEGYERPPTRELETSK